MLCHVCSFWAREAAMRDWGDDHHPDCPLHSIHLLPLLRRIADGISRWAGEEDGVPDWLWDDYRELRSVTGEN